MFFLKLILSELFGAVIFNFHGVWDKIEEILERDVKKPLLNQLDEVLRYFCNGFIHETKRGKNGSVNTGFEYTEEGRIEIFESAVKLIYRCLFLFYAEARRLFPEDPKQEALYRQRSMQTLGREARKFRWGQRRDNDGYDLWGHLKGLVNAVNTGDPEYGIMGYDGGLFNDDEEVFLGQHELRNDFLSTALYLLAYVEPFGNDMANEYPIPYEDLEVRHLGELYENILEYTVLLADADRIRRKTKNGMEILLAADASSQIGDALIKKGEVYFGESVLERKQTGSYYTPESLVKFLNQKSIIDPLREVFSVKYRKRFDELLSEALTGMDDDICRGAALSAMSLITNFVKEDVLTFKVCDPAMGSGHFLVDATNQMAGFVISLIAEVPYFEGMDSEVGHPNYWRRLITRHCVYGVDLNPLAVDLAKLALWLNCFAVDHKLTFLDHHLRCGNSLIGIRSLDQLKSVPRRKKDRRKNEGDGQLFNLDDLSELLTQVTGDLVSIDGISEDDTDTPKAILDKTKKDLSPLRSLADLYTAYLMDQTMDPEDYRQLFYNIAQNKNRMEVKSRKLTKSVRDYSRRHSFFHWPLEFPDILGPSRSGGFSATVGNPPWDAVKAKSQEFFVRYNREFRTYGKQKANRVAKRLLDDNAEIAAKWQQYNDNLSEQSNYFKEPFTYRFRGKGDINSFKLFLEQTFNILAPGGNLGIVVPSGLYTDAGCQPLRELFFENSQIRFLYSFENRWPVKFNGVDGRFKFVLFGLKKGEKTNGFKCVFMEHDPELLPMIEANALTMTVGQVERFSPETKSVMEFKTQRDIDVTEKIYGDWPLLGQQLKDSWNVRFRRELDMTNDSHLFKTFPTDCPLYEGKMIWHFDSHFEKPQYWLDRKEVVEALGENAWEGMRYRVGFRNVAASTNERSLVAGIVPPAFHGNSFPTITPCGNCWEGPNVAQTIWAASILSSFSVDFLIRQKVSMNLNFFFVESLPMPRSNVDEGIFDAMVVRAARLYCYHDDFAGLWQRTYMEKWASSDFWYPPIAPIDDYGPIHEQEIRKRLRDEAKNLTQEWGPHCGVHDRLADRRDTGDRAQLRAEIDAYVAHLYGLSRDDFAYILDTFPVLRRKEEQAFGEFKSKRKCLEEYDRIKLVLEHQA